MKTLLRLALVAVLAGVAIALALRLDVPPVTEREIREVIFSAIEREAPEAFVITGTLELSVSTLIEDSRVVLPSIIGLSLGTTRATVRLPGRVSYGFPADSLRPGMVAVGEDGRIEVELPPLSVYSVEPDLALMEVETQRGWARLPGTAEEVERQAIAVIEGAFRRQGTAHLSSSYQPRINSARALQRLLSPALQGLGMDEPSFRFRVGDDLVVEPSG